MSNNKIKKILICSIMTCFIILVTGCTITKEKVKETNTSEKQCEITKKVKSSIKCPEMINIKQSSPGFFITEEGILYEYSYKEYSKTNTNCKKVETNIVFDKLINDTLVTKAGEFYSYSYSSSKLSKVSPATVSLGMAPEITIYLTNPNIDFLGWSGSDARESYGYVKENKFHSITYDYNNNTQTDEELYTFDSDEFVVKITNGYVSTNKNYYNYSIINKKECKKYADIECKYGLVPIDTIDNCSDIIYLSNHLLVDKNVIQ